MTIRLRTTFFIAVAVFSIWLLYILRQILTPFVLAAIFAYIFNPVVNFFNHKLRLPRSLSVIIIYVVIIAAIIFLGIALVKRVIDESSALRVYIEDLIRLAEDEVDTLPAFIRPIIHETLLSLQKTGLSFSASLISLFPKAVSSIVGFFVFLFSAFYFLKEGRNIFDRLVILVPNPYKVEIEILNRKINAVLRGYLRGQIFMVFLVILILFVALSIVGVKFALILAIFSGFAEIVPFIGPITAGSVAAIVVFINRDTNFALGPFQAVVVVVLIYFVVRQIQDYFIAPHVMGRVTKLHPLVILFAVLAGQHLGGLLGLILAVPIAGSIKILFEFSFDKINERNRTTLGSTK